MNRCTALQSMCLPILQLSPVKSLCVNNRKKRIRNPSDPGISQTLILNNLSEMAAVSLADYEGGYEIHRS